MKYTFTLFLLYFSFLAMAQPVPAEEENIPFLVTFGKDAGTKWGDDDFNQVFFFSIPENYKKPFYIRVFDPDCGGKFDEANADFNSIYKFSLYGGERCISNPNARAVDPIEDYNSGNLIMAKSFKSSEKYDGQWYTFGPIDPSSGEKDTKYGASVFKLICEGLRGDDGNLYRYFMSTEADRNIPIEGGNAFTFEYCFRLHSDPKEISHIYPFVDDATVSIIQYNFDWDNEGYIKLVSFANAGEYLDTSEENEWAYNKYVVSEKEKMKSLDIQFKKDKDRVINNNNVVFYVTNQYGEMLPFYTIPIGGIPKPQGTVSIKSVKAPRGP